jgi:hypothetical protein
LHLQQAVCQLNCLSSLECWNHGFESQSKHGCLCASSVFVLPCIYVAALRRADPPSKGSYRLCKKDYETEEEARAEQRPVEPLMDELIYVT